MASVITIRIKYDDNSRSFTESYTCADSFPSTEIIKACQDSAWARWEKLGHSSRAAQMNVTIKRA